MKTRFPEDYGEKTNVLQAYNSSYMSIVSGVLRLKAFAE